MKKKIFLRILVLAILCTNFISCNKKSTSEPELTLTQRLQNELDNALEASHGMGISAAVYIPGHELWLGVSGVSHGSIPLTKEMKFSIGSTTKNFTAALTLRLVEEEMLTLEDSLHEWLPNYTNIDSTITIRQLLNHTCGIFNMTDHPTIWDSVFADLNRVWTPDEIVNNFVLEPYFPPGSGWHYSNTGYILLGMIIREATGSEVSTALRFRFLNPLGLNNTFLEVEEMVPGMVVHGWIDINGDGTPDDLSLYPRVSIYSGAWTAGAMVSTAEDLVKWTHALFRGDVLDQETLGQMLVFQSPCPGEPLVSGYGLGLCQFYMED
jgi:D-alanyl-D-alanine carboxypeptidase